MLLLLLLLGRCIGRSSSLRLRILVMRLLGMWVVLPIRLLLLVVWVLVRKDVLHGPGLRRSLQSPPRGSFDLGRSVGGSE